MYKKIIGRHKTNVTDSEQCWKMNNNLVYIKFLFLLLPLQVDNMEEFPKNSDI
jgi:hypothetical protein